VKPTLAIQEQIVTFVRAGGYPHVAAQAVGVPQEVFETWMARGTAPRPRKVYRTFRAAIIQAQAQARLAAEVAILKDEPLRWLLQGPGRERQDNPGWSSLARPLVRQDNRSVNVMLSPQVQELMSAIAGALAEHPEARAKVAAALEDKRRDQ
jgi:hypothetical protein